MPQIHPPASHWLQCPSDIKCMHTGPWFSRSYEVLKHSLRVFRVTLMVARTHHIRHTGHDGLHLVKELFPLRGMSERVREWCKYNKLLVPILKSFFCPSVRHGLHEKLKWSCMNSTSDLNFNLQLDRHLRGLREWSKHVELVHLLKV